MKNLPAKFRAMPNTFFARTPSILLMLATLFIFSRGTVVLAQKRELPANSIQRMLNAMRLSGKLPATPNMLAENPDAPALSQGAWTAAAVSSAVGRYAFAQVGEDLYVISGRWCGRNSYDSETLQCREQIYGRRLRRSRLAEKRPRLLILLRTTRSTSLRVISGNLIRIYDIATNSWSAGAARPGFADEYGLAAGAYQGKVFVVGGDADSGANPTLSIYDIASNSWTTGPNAPAAYQLGGYTQVGRFLYVVGGYTQTNANSNVTMRLDMSNNTWTTGPVFTPQRADFALAASGSKLFAIGGDTTGGDAFNASALVDELETSTWPSGSWVSSAPNLPTARQANSAGFFSTGRVGGEIWTTGGISASFAFLTQHLFRANALELTNAVSRKSHGGTPYDIDLPLTGTSGGGMPNWRRQWRSHLSFTFTTNVVSGSATVTEGMGTAGAANFSGHTMTVPLSGVTDVQKITVTLDTVTDAAAQVLPSTSVSMNVLLGDTSGNKIVNATDVLQTKLQSGIAINAANFRNDTNVSGSISATDVSQVKLNSGHGLP